MPATPVQETHTTVTTVQGGAVAAGFTAEFSAESTSTTTTQVQTEQVETVTVTETSSSGESHSSSHTSTTGGGAVFTSSERSEAHGSIEAHGSSVSGSSSSTTVTQGSGTIAQGFTTSVDGAASSTTVAHGSTSATSVGGAASSTTVAHGSTTTTSGASCTPAQPAQPAQPAPVKDSEHVQKKIRDGRLGAHGVNLGGWLVAEQWMSGSSDIWKDVPQGYEGEYQVLVHGNDRDQRLANFEKHHATFITEQDIAAIAKAGFNMVRVPVGYWILGDDLDDPGHKEEMKAFPRNTVQWVDKLIREWAVRHNVAVLVDIHAAKGSQNGDQHSAPTVSGQAFWGKYPENVRNTVLLAKFIGDRYKNDDAFLGIGLLNEPAADTDEKVLAQYHQDAYRAVRESGNNCILSCMPYRYKQEPDNLVGFMEAPEYTNVWIEWHPYFIWGNENKSGDELINQTISTEFQEKVNKWNSRPGANKLFISEWSLANTGQFRDPDSPEFAAWARAQVKVMNQAKAGWAYWSWHIEGDDKEGSFEAWSAKSVIRREPLRQVLLESTDESAIAA